MAFCVYKDLEMDITVVQEPSEDCPSSPECNRPKNDCLDSTLSDDDYSHPCDSCDLEFSSIMSLWKHIENMHGGTLTVQLGNRVNSHGADSHDTVEDVGNQNSEDINTCDIIGKIEPQEEDEDTKDINMHDITRELETETEDADTKDVNTHDILEEIEDTDTKDINTHGIFGEVETKVEDTDTKDINTHDFCTEIRTQVEDAGTKDINTCEFIGEIGTKMGNMDRKDINMHYIVEETSSHEQSKDCPEVNIQDNGINEDRNNRGEGTSTETTRSEKHGQNQDKKVTKSTKCGKEFKTKGEQRTHRCLRKANPFPCDECGKMFQQPSDLKKHMSVHSKEKLYSCKHRGCGKTFSIQRNLNRHMRTHKEEKPFSCSQSEETFTQSSELKVSPEPVCLEDTSDIKGQVLNTNDFQAIVETFRRLHPSKRQCDPTRVLDSKLKEWRAKCMAVLGLESEKTYFGGAYKEHLAVSVMSQRCYDTASSIMKQYRLNQHPKQKSTIVNRALFKEVPGTRDEEALYQALLDFSDGKIGKEKFNRTLKIMKQGKQKDELSWKRENEKLRQELKRQQAIIESQEKRIATLEAELRTLKASQDDGPSEMEVVESSDDTVSDDLIHGHKEDKSMMIGKMMEGKDEETGMWFKVKIMEERNSRVKVHWMSYSKSYDSWIEQSLLRPLKSKFSQGDKVSARYNISNGTTYPAIVVAVDGDKVLLQYEDGLEKKIHQRYVEERQSAA
ncbi:uncharacterized protein [Haliotis asinina]|uniref:uncharacterized protein isoform X2 n=1 Tax=Haliotis asinina TaxID=109174 RepID=UPI0035321E63